MRQAKRVFAERLAHFAPQLGVQYKVLRLSSAGTRWGSASVDGTIRLNWRLIHLSLEMVDYVVVHELSHLRHMDHSPQFWDVVASVMPDHHLRRQALKRAAVPLQD
jgi:predicted metal-dependent hydrolase